MSVLRPPPFQRSTPCVSAAELALTHLPHTHLLEEHRTITPPSMYALISTLVAVSRLEDVAHEALDHVQCRDDIERGETRLCVQRVGRITQPSLAMLSATLRVDSLARSALARAVQRAASSAL